MNTNGSSTKSHELGFKPSLSSHDKVKKATLDTSRLKKTNRLIRSCMSCKKRKVKCNFEIPCDRCIARNQAHLCSREPIIFDGMIVTSEDHKELKFSQENEVLKKKIKELQDTILKMKNPIQSADRAHSDIKPDNIRRQSSAVTTKSSQNVKLKLDNQFISDKRSRYARHCNLVDPERWQIYASTVSMLKTALTNGLVLETTSNSETCELDYNTEEWLVLNDERFANYPAEDSKAKCWQYELTKISCLDESICEILVLNGLKFCKLIPIINIDEFLSEFHAYWADDTIVQKHVEERYSKSSKTYLFLGMMYSLMCLGVYHCSDEDMEKLNFSVEDWDTFPKAFFAAGLECLFSGRFMTHPHFRSIQTIALLRLLSGVLGGNVLSNNLTCVAFFLIPKLGLSGSTEKVKMVNFWYLLAYDWYDDQERYCLSDMHAFANIEPPSKWTNSKTALIDWNLFYLNVFVEVAKVKRKYYYSDIEKSFENLSIADIELRYLQLDAFQKLENFTPKLYPFVDIDTFKLIEFHSKSLLLYEALEVNTKLAQFMTYEEWSKKCYQTCYNNAMELTQAFTSSETPPQFKFYPKVCGHVIFAAVFLIVNCLLDSKHFRQYESIKSLVKNCTLIFNSHKSLVRCAARGTYVLEKLLMLLNYKTKKRNEKRNNTSNVKTDQITSIKPKSCSNPDVKIKSVGSARSPGDDSSGSSSEDESSDNYSNYSSDSDDNLYYMTMMRQKEQREKMLTGNPQVGGAIDINTDQNQQLLTSDQLPSGSTTSKMISGLDIEPALNPPQTEENTVPSLQHTIMDILEDFGWSNFMNSMDNLNNSDNLETALNEEV